MFMHIKAFETHALDGPETDILKNSEQSFPRIKIYGMQGTNTDILNLSKHVNCAGGIESWGDQILENMRAGMVNALADALYNYKNAKSEVWFSSVTTYVMTIITLCQFTREIEECFDNFENNVRTFTDYRKNLQDKIEKYTRMLYNPRNKYIYPKLTSAITIINYQLYILEKIIEFPSGFERRNFWENRVRLRYRQATSTVEVWFGSKNFSYGYEYWGNVPPIFICNSKFTAIENICAAIASNNAGIILGDAGSGKKELISAVAAMFGKHIAFCPSFNDPSSVSVLRNVAGAILCHSWIVFPDIQRYSQSTLAMLADIYRDIKSKEDLPIQYEIGNYTVRLSDQFILFATGPTEMRVPETIKHEFAPIVINEVDAKSAANIELSAYGFRNSDLLAERLITCIKRITAIFEKLPCRGTITNALAVIKIAKLYIEIAKTSENEDFVLAWATFHHFQAFTSLEFIPMLEHIIYDIFYPTSEFNMFHIYLPNRMGNFIERRCEKIEEKIPHDMDKYVKGKVSDFLRLLFTTKCVFVYGSSNSGKSSIVEAAVNAINQTEDEIPTKVFEIYHAANTINETFGWYDYQKDGHVFNDGIIAPILKEIRESNNMQFIIKFNGPITDEFSVYLTGMLNSKPQDVIMFNNYETFNCENVHIVVETDSIEKVTPQIVSFAVFIPMRDSQTIRSDPIPIFERAKVHNSCPPEGLKHIRD
ncbi:dynein light chain binding, partial [Trichomonas vaginalis G3]